MARYMVPRYVEIRDCLPRTSATDRVEQVKLIKGGLTANTWDRERDDYIKNLA